MLKTASAGGFTAVRLPDAVFRETQDLLRALTVAHDDTGIFVLDYSYTENWSDAENDVPTYVKRMWRDICTAQKRPCLMARIMGKRGQRVVGVTVPKRRATKPIIAWIGLAAQEQSRSFYWHKAHELGEVAYTQNTTNLDLYIPERHMEAMWTNGFLRMCREEWRDILKIGIAA